MYIYQLIWHEEHLTILFCANDDYEIEFPL